jgi:hypothetical protein
LQEFEVVRKDLAKVKNLYDSSVVYPHGHTGRLIVISMPRDVAGKISYAARPGGLLKKMHSNGKQTSNPVEIADYYDEVEDQNEFCVCITTTMLDACKAREAGIAMQTFDLRDFSKTKSWQEYQVALKALLDRVKELYEKRQAFTACEAGMGGW